MLTIHIPALESYDGKRNLYINLDEVTIELEHSLISLSKWEAIWEKPFLGPDVKTTDETIDYIRAMTLTPNIPPEVYLRLSSDNFTQINNYIDAKMSATWFTDPASQAKGPKRREIITSEIIYYWMISLQIPLEWGETRHLNQLFTLIKVCNQKNAPEKKMNKRDMIAQRNMLNAQRRAEHNTQG